jgi:hypothetical protein
LAIGFSFWALAELMHPTERGLTAIEFVIPALSDDVEAVQDVIPTG